MLPPATYPSIPSDVDDEEVVQASAQKAKTKEDKVRTKLLRSFFSFRSYRDGDAVRTTIDHIIADPTRIR